MVNTQTKKKKNAETFLITKPITFFFIKYASKKPEKVPVAKLYDRIGKEKEREQESLREREDVTITKNSSVKVKEKVCALPRSRLSRSEGLEV